MRDEQVEITPSYYYTLIRMEKELVSPSNSGWDLVDPGESHIAG